MALILMLVGLALRTGCFGGGNWKVVQRKYIPLAKHSEAVALLLGTSLLGTPDFTSLCLAVRCCRDGGSQSWSRPYIQLSGRVAGRTPAF